MSQFQMMQLAMREMAEAERRNEPIRVLVDISSHRVVEASSITPVHQANLFWLEDIDADNRVLVPLDHIHAISFPIPKIKDDKS